MLTAILVSIGVVIGAVLAVHFHLVHVKASVQRAADGVMGKLDAVLHNQSLVPKSTGPVTPAPRVTPQPRWFDGLTAKGILDPQVLIGGLFRDFVIDPRNPYMNGEYFSWLANAHPGVWSCLRDDNNNASIGSWIGSYIRSHNLGDGTAVISTPEFWDALEVECASASARTS